VVSQHRMGSSANQAAALADAVRAVGEQLIAANPIGKSSNSYITELWFYRAPVTLRVSGFAHLAFLCVSLNPQVLIRWIICGIGGDVYYFCRMLMSVHWIWFLKLTWFFFVRNWELVLDVPKSQLYHHIKERDGLNSYEFDCNLPAPVLLELVCLVH